MINSLIGPFLNISCLPDLFGSLPNVTDVLKCVSGARPEAPSPPRAQHQRVRRAGNAQSRTPRKQMQLYKC